MNEPNTDPSYEHAHGIDGHDAVTLLLRGMPWRPIMWTGPRYRCLTCGMDIDPGHTCFQSVHLMHSPVRVCHRCGVSWLVHQQIITPTEAATIPPYAGLPANSALRKRLIPMYGQPVNPPR